MKFKVLLFLTAFVLAFSFTCYADDLCSSCGLNAEVTYIDVPDLKLFSSDEIENGEKPALYEYMLEQCFLHNEKINVYDYNIAYEEMVKMCFDFAMKYPEALIYTDFSFEVTGSNIAYSVIPKYIFESVAEDEEARKKMDVSIEYYLNLAEKFDDPLEELLAVHDELVEYCDYVKDSEINDNIYHHAYSLFADKKGVCQAYSQAFYILATKLGYEVDYCVVHDDIHNLHHSWNYIKIDGEWYHLDVTHDDSVTDSGTGDTVDHGYHNHFLCSDDKIHEGTDYTYSSSTWANYLGEHIVCDSDKYESNYIFNIKNGFDIRFHDDGKIHIEAEYYFKVDGEVVKKTINFVYDDLYVKEPMIVSEISEDGLVIYELVAEVKNLPTFLRIYKGNYGKQKLQFVRKNDESLKTGFSYVLPTGKYMLFDLNNMKPLAKAIVVE